MFVRAVGKRASARHVRYPHGGCSPLAGELKNERQDGDRGREAERQRDRETERQRGREAERQRDRETERQKDRKTDH